MFEIGRLCIKIAGRDAGLKCVIVDTVDKFTVLVDGQTRRRKCNIKHLEPLEQVFKISKNAPRAEIVRVFKELKIELKETKPKKKSERPIKVRKKKQKPVKQSAKKIEKEAVKVKPKPQQEEKVSVAKEPVKKEEKSK